MAFDLFWGKVATFADSVRIEEPQLPRRRKRPARFDDGNNQHFHESPKQHYRQILLC